MHKCRVLAMSVFECFQCNSTGESSDGSDGSISDSSITLTCVFLICSKAICSETCQHGGTCSSPDTCSCAHGWTGSTCSEGL